MACARCDFYLPKDRQAQLPEAKTNLQRMLMTVPLSDKDRAVVDEVKLPSINSSAGWRIPRPLRDPRLANWEFRWARRYVARRWAAADRRQQPAWFRHAEVPPVARTPAVWSLGSV
jgi:hypothetical protein